MLVESFIAFGIRKIGTLQLTELFLSRPRSNSRRTIVSPPVSRSAWPGAAAGAGNGPFGGRAELLERQAGRTAALTEASSRSGSVRHRRSARAGTR